MMIERVVRAICSNVVDSFRKSYPFLICLLGATALVALQGKGWVGPILAGVSFIWAIDLAQTRAAAKANSEAAAKFVAALTSGHDSTITVDINYHTYRAALQEEGE